MSSNISIIIVCYVLAVCCLYCYISSVIISIIVIIVLHFIITISVITRPATSLPCNYDTPYYNTLQYTMTFYYTTTQLYCYTITPLYY